MKELTWNAFEKKIYLKYPLEKLYWLWATKEGITSWFLSNAKYFDSLGEERSHEEYIKAGDSYSWFWHNWDGQEDGKVIEANGKDFLQFEFADSLLDINLEQEGDVVILTLKQHNIPTDNDSKLKIHFGCSNGWTFWLTNLKAYVEHGILLNETEIDLRNHELSGYVFVNM
ncbi:SRPBCC domain-containing protein [Winogradskyella sp. 3972H.M.0a.05]|uniref:SRPBCC family protein n=1 Tax=Winogradskyella sp. 3972H.M.0a.05 TaxID=2950277 RepID=UPI003391D807